MYFFVVFNSQQIKINTLLDKAYVVTFKLVQTYSFQWCLNEQQRAFKVALKQD